MSSASATTLDRSGAYPERAVPRENWLERVTVAATGPAVRWMHAAHLRFNYFIRLVAEHGGNLGVLTDDELREIGENLRPQLRRKGFEDIELVAEVFAVVREIAERKLGMRHYDVQLIGGLVLLRGMIAEMEAGEGKTLMATLAACTAALAGIPVHIITVNDYLASRDTNLMRPVYEALGLSVGTIIQGMSANERRAAYACDITYCTNKEIAFDYLKDRLVLGQKRSRMRLQLERLGGKETRTQRLLLRGLCFAIVDEADSVLIDEARTPLIISGAGSGDEEKTLYEQALMVAGALTKQDDFKIVGRERRIELTTTGKVRVRELTQALGGIWNGTRRREELVRQALTAQHLFARDKHYLIKDGKVQIIDEYTGRVMPDRSWEQGLHQMMETKEDCELTQQRETLARMSYQRFFRRFVRLAGMTGTAQEVGGELWSVYRLSVVVVPTNKPVRRRRWPTMLYLTTERKWQAIVEHVGRLHAKKRPVLIGTRSVEASEHLSQLLTANGLDHQVLNARQDQEEAGIIARAGEHGRITVATNMAGRGTDIKLSLGVSERGGLHVVLTELHEAKRIDRQLFGRCARQGDMGSYSAMLSLADELPTIYVNKLVRLVAIGLARIGIPRLANALLMRPAQGSAERLHSRMRRDMLKLDDQLDTALAFSGRTE